MRILLTGADGFTGRFFMMAAVRAGHEVVPLSADLTNRGAVVAKVLEIKPDAVIHLAAISFVGHSDETAFYAVNVVGTTNLLTALTTLNNVPRKILIASSANVYGNCEASPISEEQPAAPLNHYAVSKLAMEHIAYAYLDRLPIIMTRPFNYTGPGQAGSFLIPKLVDHFFRRAPVIELGNLHVEREFNDVRMVCDAYLALLEQGEAGEVYNICSGEPYTLQHVLDTLTDITGHKIEVQVNPAFVRKNELRRLCGSPSKLRKLMDISGRQLYQPGLREMLQWMLAEPKH